MQCNTKDGQNNRRGGGTRFNHGSPNDIDTQLFERMKVRVCWNQAVSA